MMDIERIEEMITNHEVFIAFLMDKLNVTQEEFEKWQSEVNEDKEELL